MAPKGILIRDEHGKTMRMGKRGKDRRRQRAENLERMDGRPKHECFVTHPLIFHLLWNSWTELVIYRPIYIYLICISNDSILKDHTYVDLTSLWTPRT